ncbi:hypothetical protein BOTNAR_0369g00090 [Botryotinia narcissicola]|uniref:Uncharacterized protein n=1 Tax=Botryotinia narcissicola TaxID=278944 RepID=A0A4Z1HVH5_9HELO|nr:hypothetical protein BOTNAR_0369g00090 [Botryotinia narcissicola]
MQQSWGNFAELPFQAGFDAINNVGSSGSVELGQLKAEHDMELYEVFSKQPKDYIVIPPGATIRNSSLGEGSIEPKVKNNP